MTTRKTAIHAAVALATAACVPAFAALERVGPVNNAPSVGSFPGWYQDRTGIAVEFCDLRTQAELDGGWCVLAPPDGGFPEAFPGNFFDEHFYYAADNVLLDGNLGFRARLVLALEAAFANGPAVPGDQIVFGRLRVLLRPLPFDGDYRVITPFSDTTYFDQVAGDRIFETQDIGAGCQGVFDCSLTSALGPFLLPSPVAGGSEVPPMPDLKQAPPGTDPFYDAAVAAGNAPTADPGTNAKYLADPGRIGPVTGSPLPPFLDAQGSTRNHNTFRVEVRAPSPTHDGPLLYAIEGENNFTVSGRLMAGSLPGKLNSARATYKADGTGTVTAVDVFANASPTTQARIPAQPQVPPITPVLNFYDQPCAGAIVTNPQTGEVTISDGPYSAPPGVAHGMALAGSNYWGQSTPGGPPASHVCIVDTTSRNAAGQTIPTFFLKQLTDDILISKASYDGATNGTLTVNAVSTDPTAVLTLAGFGPAPAGAPGTSAGIGAGTGLDLSGGAATVSALQAPPSQVQVVSTRGGMALKNTDTGLGGAVIVGVPAASSDSVSLTEDGAPVTVDLLANDTVLLNGTLTSLRSVAASGVPVTVTVSAARLGTATVADGVLTFVPTPNASGADTLTYTVAVDGKASNPSTVTINIAPVNDAPVAGNTVIGGVVGKQNQMNLLANSTDPDGNGDLKDAVILTWPAALGPQPTPLNGGIVFTPAAAGGFSFTYKVKDFAGLLSANTATASVTVAQSEVITFGKHQFVQNKNRWTVDGTDNIVQGQTITIVYENGTMTNGTVCNGTAIPDCLIGTSPVDGLGNWGIDKVSVIGKQNPKDPSIWRIQPTFIRAFSTLPSLGGTAAIDIVFK